MVRAALLWGVLLHSQLSLASPMGLWVDDGSISASQSPGLGTYIDAGRRSAQWLARVNSKRDESRFLELWEAGSIPPSKPLYYNSELLLKRCAEAKKRLSPSVREVLFSKAQIPDSVPASISDEIFLRDIKRMESCYQTAIRWLSLVPQLELERAKAWLDMRGLLELEKRSDLKFIFENWGSTPVELRNLITASVIGVCRNATRSMNGCDSAAYAAASAGRLGELYASHLSGARRLWNSYFQVKSPLASVRWSKQKPGVVIVPFRKSNSAIERFLSMNIEEEWAIDGFQLRLEFVSGAAVFRSMGGFAQKPGIVPHVARRRQIRPTIHLDSDIPLNTRYSREVVRHEFGHVLGFPDCYVEFFDTTQQAMIYYELDEQNLMCSRNGRVLPLHFKALRRAHP